MFEPEWRYVPFFSAMIFCWFEVLLGLMDFSDIVILCIGANKVCSILEWRFTISVAISDDWFHCRNMVLA